MFIIGLTGGIGSGKSTVANYFADLGVTIIDADQIAREIFSEKTINEKINQHFGHIDRAQLRETIFTNATEREWLEQLLHPLISQQIQQRVQTAQSPYCILVIPLLLEKGQHIKVDRILVVDAAESLQTQRVQQRDQITLDQFKAIAKTQIDRAQRCKLADDIIENNGTLAELQQQVERLHQNYLRLAH